ncbi:hypothetical protein [Phenylobacterium sp.]|uniref:hypothetical protein n=1 Tax=Phenylobacterium sp. TaxID=1871053 RepID=UPI00391D4620
MDEVARLILLMAFTGGALTLLGGAFVWYLDEGRRMRRSLKKMLGGEPHALLLARGSGTGVGFDFGSNSVAVTWESGGWCLLYRVDELMGAELIRDGQVVARTHRGEARRALDQISGAEEQVRLRFVFDDPAYPDFALDLWTADDAGRRKSQTPAEALQEGNRWIARMESLLRRPVPRRGATISEAAPQAPAPAAPAPAAAPPSPIAEAPAPDEDAPFNPEASFDVDEPDDRDAPRAMT